MNDGVCLLDREGVVTHSNPAADRLLGKTHEEIIGQPAHQLLQSAFAHINSERVAYLNQVPWRQTVEVDRNSGSFRLSIVPVLDDQQHLSGSVLTITETTANQRLREQERLREDEREKAERFRGEASRMATLEQLKSQFLRLASHELRAPVGVLNGYMSMLADGSLGELPQSAQAAMPVMSAKISEISMLIDQLLDAARLEDSRLALRLERLDLCVVLQSAANQFESLLTVSHPVTLEVPAEPVIVMADRARIRIIVSNLIDNAAKYSADGTEIECSLGTWGDQATVTVRDHGLGIRPEDIDRLFTKFGRLATTENEHISGTGLGLFLSRELARMHGGDLTVESTPGVGSAFTLRLPLASNPAPTSG